MSVRLLIECDGCGAGPAMPLTVDVGNGAERVDLCQRCSDALGVARLEALLSEFGQEAEAKRPTRAPRASASSSARRWPCPRCDSTLADRPRLLNHLRNVHKIDTVEASQLAPPEAPSALCPECGYLAATKTGLEVHRRAAHLRQR